MFNHNTRRFFIRSAPGTLDLAAALVFILATLLPLPASAATLTSATEQAWNRYYRWADDKVAREIREPGKFLIQDRLAPSERKEVQRRLQSGETYVGRATGVVPAGVSFRVPDGEIHHWWGTILVPKVKLPELMRFLQDYEHHAGKFPDVVKSRLIAREGERFTFTFDLMRSKAFVTVHYHTRQEATYHPVDATRVWSKSVATRIAEVANDGTPAEKELPPGEDSGYLWRLVSWWRFQETEDGVIVELESASLSRDIPFIVRLLPGVSSYIRATPRESMESVLSSIRHHFAATR